MAIVQPVCRYYKTEFCKFKDHCKNLHVEEVCGISTCTGEGCSQRHPTLCKYLSSVGKCKFGEKCSYSHDHHLHKDVTILKQEIEEIRQRLNEFVSELDAVKTSNAYQIQNNTSKNSSRKSLPKLPNQTKNQSLKAAIPP